MAKITKKFIANDAVDASKVKFLNDTAFRARNSSDTADVELFSYNSADIFEFLKRPEIAGVATEPNQVVTKRELTALEDQINGQLEGLKPKEAVRVATTTPITLSGNQTIDGIAVVDGDRVLVKDQVNPADNGIYIVSSSNWSRSEDMNELSPVDEINGSYTFVQEGDTNKGKGYAQSGKVNAIGVDAINFVFFNSNSELLSGDGISIVGTLISVDIASDSYMEFDAGQLKNKVSPTFADATSGELMDAQDIKDAVDTKQDTLQGVEAIKVDQVADVVSLQLNEGSPAFAGWNALAIDQLEGQGAFSSGNGATLVEQRLFLDYEASLNRLAVRVEFEVAGVDDDFGGFAYISQCIVGCAGVNDTFYKLGARYYKIGQLPSAQFQNFTTTSSLPQNTFTVLYYIPVIEIRDENDNIVAPTNANYSQSKTSTDANASLDPHTAYEPFTSTGSSSYLEQDADGLRAVVSPSFSDAASGELMDAEDIKDAVDAVEVKADNAQGTADAAQYDANQASLDAAAAQGTADQAILDAATAQAAADAAQLTADEKQDPISAGDGIEIDSDVVSVKLDNGFISGDLVIAGNGPADGTYPLLGGGYVDGDYLFKNGGPGYGVYFKNDSFPRLMAFDTNNEVWKSWSISSIEAAEIETLFVPPIVGSIDLSLSLKSSRILTPQSEVVNGINSPASNAPFITYADGSGGSAEPYLLNSANGLKAKVAEELASAIQGELADASQIKTKFEEVEQEIQDLPDYVGVEAIVVDPDVGVDGEISLKLADVAGGGGSTDLVIADVAAPAGGTYTFLGTGYWTSDVLYYEPTGPNGVYLREDPSDGKVYIVANIPNSNSWDVLNITASASDIQNLFSSGVAGSYPYAYYITGGLLTSIDNSETQNGALAPILDGIISYVGGSSEVSYLSQSAEGLKAVVADDYASAGADQLMDAQDIKDQFQVVEDTKQDNISAGDGIELDGVEVSVKLDEVSSTAITVLAQGSNVLTSVQYFSGLLYFKSRENGNTGNPPVDTTFSIPLEVGKRYVIVDGSNAVWEFDVGEVGGGNIQPTLTQLTNITKNGFPDSMNNNWVDTLYVSPSAISFSLIEANGDSYLLNSANGLKAKVAVDYASAQAGELMDADDIKQAIDAAGHTSVKQTILLTITDISNGYVDLDQAPKPMSCDVTPVGGPLQEEGVDYVISGNILTFAGDLSADLEVGDKLMVKYVF